MIVHCTFTCVQYIRVFRTVDAQFPRFLFREEDNERGFDAMNLNEWRVGVVRARNCNLQIATHQQLG